MVEIREPVISVNENEADTDFEVRGSMGGMVYRMALRRSKVCPSDYKIKINSGYSLGIDLDLLVCDIPPLIDALHRIRLWEPPKVEEAAE
jgi:hypothetical protein